MAAIASSRGSTPLSAKKHGCITVLIRLAMPVSWATWLASMTQRSRPLAMISAWISNGRWSHTSSGGYGLLTRNVAPGRAGPSRSTGRSRNDHWWQATKSAPSIR